MAPEPPARDDATRLRVEITALRKSFRRAGGELVRAVDDVSLAVHPGEILVLLGPSGCGKSTLLRCIAGLEQPEGGRLVINGTPVYDGAASVMVPANARDVNMMFQSYALWPHMTLEDNVAYPLRVEGRRRRAARATANEYLELVGLAGLGKQYVATISGGQQQRVALARTLISEPSVVLFDEPLSNVDAKVRAQLRGQLLRIHRELGFAAVYVTHDQIEAMGLGTRIAIMREGSVEQLADPVTIYEDPATRYAAEFVGEANFLRGTVKDHRGAVSVLDCELGEIEVPAYRLATDGGPAPAPGTTALLMVRPELCRIGAAPDTGNSAANSWTGTVDTVMYAGSRTEYTCALNGQTTLTVWQMASGAHLAAGARVRVDIPADVVRVVEVGRP